MSDPVWAIDDERRLEALRETGLLDAEPAEVFDELTRLTRQALGVPVALVSLVDDHRQRFAGAVGLPDPWAFDRETPLSHSFCQYVVAADAPLVIGDARGDVRVCDNLAIRDIGVIAYAGMPLRTPEGVPLGSLCAIDTEPREWTDAQLDMLRGLASAVTTEIALRLVVVRQRATAAALREHLDDLERAGGRGRGRGLRRRGTEGDEGREALAALRAEIARLEDVSRSVGRMSSDGRGAR